LGIGGVGVVYVSVRVRGRRCPCGRHQRRMRRSEMHLLEIVIEQKLRDGLDVDLGPAPGQMETRVLGGNDSSSLGEVPVQRVDVGAGRFGGEPEVGVQRV